MVTTGHYGERYFGKWYKNWEAQKIETDMAKDSKTGDNWGWVDRNGNGIDLSGTKKLN